MHKRTGFTIIELLVIIAILAVLTSIVLVNLITYKIKSKDSATKEDMHSMVLNGSIYFEAHGNYGAFCNDATTQTILNAITSPDKKNCNHSNPSWASCVTLNVPSDGSLAWCVDSVGVKKQINNNQCTNGIHACP